MQLRLDDTRASVQCNMVEAEEKAEHTKKEKRKPMNPYVAAYAKRQRDQVLLFISLIPNLAERNSWRQTKQASSSRGQTLGNHRLTKIFAFYLCICTFRNSENRIKLYCAF